ncbi:hypothetical protein T492DRAFT_893959 [Pavlovales sp. CCMP2436]|nr:hypothetical protein T492DRAFT_893959 [Pavlovales sp. CCMP2436]
MLAQLGSPALRRPPASAVVSWSADGIFAELANGGFYLAMSDEDEQLPGSSSEPVDMTEDETLGRGKRVLKSRLITVDGQQVLRLNNYDLEDGEPSVFDRELGDDEAEGTQRRVWQPRAEPAPKKAPTERKAPSAPSVAERNRVSRNDVIKAEKERAGIRCRAVFQQTHKSLFEEFGGNIPEKSEALALLSEEDKEEMEAELVEAKTLKQPEEILIEMRDYQFKSS